MLANLNLPTLQERRNRAKLQMLYKVIHQLVAIPNNCLTPISKPLSKLKHFVLLVMYSWLKDFYCKIKHHLTLLQQ